MRTFKQFAADEWSGLTGGLAADRQAVRERRQAAWAPYGGPSRYYLSGLWKAFVILFVAGFLSLLTTTAIKSVVPASDTFTVAFIAFWICGPLVLLASGIGRSHPSGARDISTGPMLKNLFVYTPVKVVAYGWFVLCVAVILLGGFGLVMLGLRYL